jgi:NAD(P)-dependent dehydrogenase (short-subunit alcohol dehydrogenase family)
MASSYLENLFSLKGRTAVVVGGTGVLGGALADGLGGAGAFVVVAGRGADRGEARVQAIRDAGGDGMFVSVDATDRESVKALLAATVAARGKADILVNCAGIAPAVKTIGKGNAPHPLDTFRKTIEVNLIGTFNVISKVAARAADLPTPAALAAMLTLADYLPQQDDDPGGYGTVLAIAPAPADAKSRCLGLRMRLSGEAGKLIVQVRTRGALVNVTGNIADLTKNNAAPFAFQTLSVVTDTAPVVLANVYVDKKALAGPGTPYPNYDFPPSLNVSSASGDIFMDLVTSSGVAVRTGGSIYSNTVGSFSFFNCAGICGDVNLTTTGTGKIVIVQAFGGNNAAVILSQT